MFVDLESVAILKASDINLNLILNVHGQNFKS